MRLTGCERIAAEARFVRFLRQEPNGCRVWTGCVTRGGNRPHSSWYGQFKVTPKRTIRAHIFAAYLAGKIPSLQVPAGMHLDHHCEHATLCVDCVTLIPAVDNLKLIHTRPQPKAEVAARQLPKPRKKSSRPAKKHLRRTG